MNFNNEIRLLEKNCRFLQSKVLLNNPIFLFVFFFNNSKLLIAFIKDMQPRAKGKYNFEYHVSSASDTRIQGIEKTINSKIMALYNQKCFSKEVYE